MDYKQFLKGKEITLLGLGLLGRGVGDAMFLAKYCKKLTVTDLKNRNELRQSLIKLKKYKNIKFVLGKHNIKDFQKTDLVIKGAGVPLESPFIKEAIKNKIPVYMSTALFTKFFIEQFKGIVIGITGTRGKTTTTHLIYHTLKKYNKNIILGGNIQGLSTLSILDEIKEGSVAVLELDSWQLQGFGDIKISPQISVFTNLFSDHMNYYKNDMGKYLSDKANIFLWQKKDDCLILGKKIAPVIKKIYGKKIKSKISVAKQIRNLNFNFQLPGEHNLTNLSCAINAIKKLGVSEKNISKALKTFKSVPGRLEYIGTTNGIKIYNDTTSTTPEAGMAALESFKSKKSKVILICGGSDKGLDMNNFLDKAIKNAKKIILLSGSGTEKIKPKLENSLIYKSLGQAVKTAFKYARKGDVILFSPSFASFGMFRNEYDRGDKFNKEIKKYLNKNV